MKRQFGLKVVTLVSALTLGGALLGSGLATSPVAGGTGAYMATAAVPHTAAGSVSHKPGGNGIVWGDGVVWGTGIIWGD